MYTLRVRNLIPLHNSVFLKNTGSYRLISGPWHDSFHAVFGDNSASVKECDIVQLCIRTIDAMTVYVTAYFVPVICSPVSNETKKFKVLKNAIYTLRATICMCNC